MRNLIIPLLAAGALVLSTAPVHADLGDQLFKLLPDDGAAEDSFGYSVAISGDIALVGAFGDDDEGANSGSAYLFDTSKGQQVFKLHPSAPFGSFGQSVAISGTTALVGAYEGGAGTSGSVYLFDITTGLQLFRIVPSDGVICDHFGWSVAVSGTTAIVGAPFDSDNGNQSGSAYLYDISDPTNPVELAKIVPSDGAVQDHFGWSVAISGTIAIVGARDDDDDNNGADSGSAYLFDISDPIVPVQIAKLVPSDGEAQDFFGDSVAISGTTAIVGAWHDDDNGVASGSAYLYDATTGEQLFKLLASNGGFADNFGESVAINGDIAIVGATGALINNVHTGSAYYFDISDRENPVEIFELRACDAGLGDVFGWSVAISGSPGNEVAIVGARSDDDNGTTSGSAYLFDAAGRPETCPWDLDNGGDVGVKDLLFLLGVWGPCKDCPCPTDFDTSGDVGVKDLLILLGAWGPCP